MPLPTQLDQLLDEWETRWEAGEDVTAEKLCAGAPGLASNLQLQIAALKATDWLRHDAATGPFASNGQTATDGAAIERADDDLPASKLDIHEFFAALATAKLVTETRLAEFLAERSENRQFSTARDLASALVERRLLTRYQARVLLSQSEEPLTLDRYIVLHELDAGGMGVVYKAMHRSLDRLAAIKVLPSASVDSPDKVRRFRREVRAVASLSHPNIVAAHDAAEVNGVHFLVMEYVPGENLARRVRREGPLSADAAVRCVLQAARGLEHAHRRGIVHRDVKPANLLLSADGTVKVLDLGLARIDGPPEAGDANDLTREGVTMGTVAFMAPEQALDGRAADERSDVYSLGCTLYFLLTGRPPYRGATSMQTLVAHREQPVPSLQGICQEAGAELDSLLRRMLAKQPGERPRSMTEICAMLESWLARRVEAPSRDAQSGSDGLAAGIAVRDGRSPRPDEDAGLPPTVSLSSPAVAPAPRHQRPRRRGALFVLVASILMAIVAGIVVKLSTRDGTLTIELPDNGEYRVLVDGERAEIIARDGRTLTVSVPPGERKLLVALPDGTELRTDAEEGFTMAAGGGKQVRVWLDPPEEAMAEAEGTPSGDADDDRRLAEWVLSVGGTVGVGDDAPVWNEEGTFLQPGDELPEAPFRLYSVALLSTNRAADDDLARLKQAQRLHAISLTGADFTGAGLAHLRDLAELHSVDLLGTRVDAGCAAALTDLPQLKTLLLDPSSVDDDAWEAICGMGNLERLQVAGGDLTAEQLQRIEGLDGLANLGFEGQPNLTNDQLRLLHGLPRLAALTIFDCPVTGAGLEVVAEIDSLESLYLIALPLTGEGLAHLSRLRKLRRLVLARCAFGETAASHFGEMPALEVLDLSGSSVTDAGLEHLEAARRLTLLNLSRTNVTAEGVAALQAALPDCRIEWSRADPDRAAATWALSVGGRITVSVGGQGRVLIGSSPLPDEDSRLTHVTFEPNAAVADDGLATLRGLAELKQLSLKGLPVTDRGLAALGPQPTMVNLILIDLPIGDAGMATVSAGMPHLRMLIVQDAAVTDAGAECLAPLEELSNLDLRGAPISDVGIRHIARMPNLSELRVAGTSIGDESLALLGRECRLTYLDVSRTQVTAEGLVHLLPMRGLYGLWLDGIPMTANGLETLGKLSSLEGVFLADCGLTDESLPSLGALTRLKHLGLAGNPLSPAAVERLRTQLPDCEIVWSPPAEMPDAAE